MSVQKETEHCGLYCGSCGKPTGEDWYLPKCPHCGVEFYNAKAGHIIINAFEMCPHLWDLIEDAAATGSIDLTVWTERVAACTQCKKDLLSLIKRVSAGATGTASFIVNQAIAMFEKRLNA